MIADNRDTNVRRTGSVRSRVTTGGVTALSIAAVLAVGVVGAFAKGGTAKPPAGGGGGGGVVATPQVTILPPAGPVLAPAGTGAGFSITGFIQSATVDGNCGGAATAGGTVTVNGIVVTIPTNMIVQFPANTLTWKDTVCPTQAGVSPLGLDFTAGSGGSNTTHPSVEITLDGNIVGGIGGTHVAALAHITQQSFNSGSGYISFIDYTDGSIYVTTRTVAGGVGELRLLINDPNGRFGRAQSSVDARFSVDDANPTIKAAATGYPMCIPRTDPATADDPLCPRNNRPISDGTANTCRTFALAGVAPTGGEITPTPQGSPCRAFVMKAVSGMPGTAGFVGALASNLRGAADPDPRQQVPFAIGDFITWNGTLVRKGNTVAPLPTRTTSTPDLIWVHTIDANVGVYTQPKTLPSYVAIGDMGIGVDPSPTGLAVAPGVEATARIFLEAGVSDVGSIVDIYLDDKGFTLPAGNTTGPLVASAGSEFYRWITTEGMTGTLTDQAAGKNPFITVAQPFGGGIQTQYTGPQSGRARIRANKVPAINAGLPCPLSGGSQGCAVTQSPTRYVRAVVRSLCAPASTGTIGTNNVAVPASNLDNTPFFTINGPRAVLPASGPPLANIDQNAVAPAAGDGSCLQSAQYANGLFSGQYMAPVGEYIFPENTLAGAPIIPANVNQLGFIVYGEGGGSGISAGTMVPQPW